MFRSVESFRCDLDIIILHSRVSLPYGMYTEATMGVHRIDIERLDLARLPMSKTQPVKSKRIENWGQIILLYQDAPQPSRSASLSVPALESDVPFSTQPLKNSSLRCSLCDTISRDWIFPLVRSYAN